MSAPPSGPPARSASSTISASIPIRHSRSLRTSRCAESFRAGLHGWIHGVPGKSLCERRCGRESPRKLKASKMPVFAGQNREQLRQMYLDAWRKYTARQPLEPLEAQVAAVIAEHPEYVPLLESGSQALAADYTPEGGRENPFLHMGLHLAIREQVATDRPAGITRIHQDLSKRFGDAHAAEHTMLEALAETLWESQRAGRAPDE